MKKYNLGIYLGVLVTLFAATLTSEAGIYTNLHAFVDGNVNDGSGPSDAILINGQLFGATAQGGAANKGIVYTLGTNGGGFASIHDFAGSPTDGEQPNDLLQVGNMIYGTTFVGGTNGGGTVFKLNTNGSGYVILRSFTNSPDPQFILSGLAISGPTLYGTSLNGGANGKGSVFKIDTNGANFAVLHDFAGNPDGANPRSRLLVNGATIYGTTSVGGTNDAGTIFKLNINGLDYSVIAHFSNAPAAMSPYVGLTYDNNTLYGVSSSGGTGSAGTVFRLSTNGTDFSIIHSFTNNEGLSPQSALVLNNLLYGATLSRGTGLGGTIFQLGTNGANFTVLKNFTNSQTGVNPRGQLILTGNTIYGVANALGPNNGGTVFRLVLAPVIDSQPQNLTVTNGNPASFSVTAADEFPMTYQWYFNTNTLLAGQTASTLNLSNATNGNAGAYTVVVTDNGGSVTSSPAVLSVVSGIAAPPNITSQPQNLTVTNGNPASFSVTATTGTGSLAYQWYFNTNTLLVGQTASTFNLTPALTNNAGYYTVIVGNGSSSVTSSPARLTVSNPPPAITAQPQNLNVTNGNPASFSVTATTVNGPLLYQWYFNTNTLLAGQTNNTYNIPVTFTNFAGFYNVVVANNGGTVTSSPARLTVATNSKPVISDQTRDQYVNLNDTATMSVTASGLGPLGYQWYTNTPNTNVYVGFGGRTTALISTTATTNKQLFYICIVTNSLGKATSSPAYITVVSKPIITTNPPPVTVIAGNITNFFVGAVGASLSYQWYSNNVNTAIGTLLAGQTTNIYSFTAATNQNGKFYSVVVSNSFGKTTSSPSLLIVGSLPTITIQPQPGTVGNGAASSLTFTSGAAGPGPLSYQWIFNTNTFVINATNTTLTVTDTNPAGYYAMMAANSFGSVTSSAALLTVLSLPPPTITLQPLGATITNGSSITFTSAASGTGPLGYQWLYQTNILIPGATSTSLTFATANQPGTYSMKVTNSAGAATSSPALLNVVAQPILLSSSFDTSSGSYSFSYVNLAGSANRLQATTNLADPNAWQTIATNIMATNGIWQVTDPKSAQTNAIRLYRFSSP